MPTLSEIFDKRKIFLYQNESLDLDHYYQEPYQDENDEIKEMGRPFETNESKKFRTFDLVNEDRTYSGFSYFMDGSRSKNAEAFLNRSLLLKFERDVRNEITGKKYMHMGQFIGRIFCS